ncbi:hypothetical protein [Methanobacterium oryzae]|uniref:hypothetical protein n=1 Tax=Methanobacterium oryzae TaxID=69540 RepID=UPI003D19873C
MFNWSIGRLDLRIVEGRVRSCLEEHIIFDKKLRKRSYRLHKFMIPLNDNHPFTDDESVVVISKEDYDKLKANIIKIKDIKRNLEIQIEDYKKNEDNIETRGLLSIIKKNLF